MLQKGDKAPDFKGIGQNEEPLSLSMFSWKKVVLYFYPKDNTPGCTAESCNLRDNYQELLNKNIAIIGVSADSEKSHKNFSEKYKLPFPLIADTSREIVKAYGVWGQKKFMGRTFDGIHRTTFIISEDGIIEEVITKVNTTGHSKQILEFIK
jgi:peroxiredoxin Q/BCP